MKPFQMILADGSTFTLNEQENPLVNRYLSRPKAVVAEMISQASHRHYYYGLFEGRQGLTFLDIGANLGIVSLFASPCCRRIVAVEAEPKTCEVMAALLLPLGDRFSCINAALAAHTGNARLSIDQRDWSCHTTTNPIPGHPFVTVKALSFPDLLTEACLSDGVDVCKVDVEGSEMDSLTEEVIRVSGVKQWYIEAHRTPSLTRCQSVAELRRRLVACGFKVNVPRPNALVTSRL